MKAILIIGNNIDLNSINYQDSYVVGIDKGALKAVENNIFLDLALGDFDSINETEYQLLTKKVKNIIKLNPIKDDTDTSFAINMLKNYDEILILGAIAGKRIEHFYANIIELKNNPKISLLDNNSYIYTKDKSFMVSKGKYKYISIFSLSNDTVISLKGFKYDLDNYHLEENNPLGVSNEIISDIAKIDIISGRILIIESKNDNEKF